MTNPVPPFPLPPIGAVFGTQQPVKGAVYDGNANVAGGIKKTKWTHEDMIDFMISNPAAKQKEIAERYGYTEGWVSRMISSDAFKQHWARRRDELVDPVLLQATETRFRALVDESLDRLQEKLKDMTSDGLVKVAEVASRALGYGVAKGANVSINNNTQYVVALPPKAPDSQSWEAKYSRAIPAIEEK